MGVMYCCSVCGKKNQTLQFIIKHCSSAHPSEYFFVEKINTPDKDTEKPPESAVESTSTKPLPKTVVKEAEVSDVNSETDKPATTDSVGDKDVSTSVGVCNVQSDKVGNVDSDKTGNVDCDKIGNVDSDKVGNVDFDKVGNVDSDKVGNVDSDNVGSVVSDKVCNVNSDKVGNVDSDMVGNVDSTEIGNADTVEIGNIEIEIAPSPVVKLEFDAETAMDCVDTIGTEVPEEKCDFDNVDPLVNNTIITVDLNNKTVSSSKENNAADVNTAGNSQVASSMNAVNLVKSVEDHIYAAVPEKKKPAKSKSNLRGDDVVVNSMESLMNILMADNSVKVVNDIKTEPVESPLGLKYHCGFCPEQFDDNALFRKHLQKHFFQRESDFVCSVCMTVFAKKSLLDIHMVSHKEEPLAFKCRICMKSFKEEETLEDHLRWNHKEEKQRPHQCDQCGRHFSTDLFLKEHLRLKHPLLRKNYVELHRCDVCNRSFNTKSGLISHSMIHSHKNPFTCKICNKKFINNLCMRKHMATHENTHNDPKEKDDPFMCRFCVMKFSDANELEEHLRSHSSIVDDDGLFCCKICKRKFSSKVGVDNHIQKKHGSSTQCFRCKICLKIFLSENNLQLHMKSHDINRPFKCTICKNTYRTQEQWQLHLRWHSLQDVIYNCVDCDFNFPDELNYTKHLALHSMETMQCDKCSQVCKSAKLLQLHLWKHENAYHCFCGEEFFLKKTYELHQEKMHSLGNSNKCAECEQSFANSFDLKNHELTHKKMYECLTCKKTFNRESAYHLHLKRHNDVFLCEICNQDFNSDEALKQHVVDNLAEEKVSCNVCNKEVTMRCHSSVCASLEPGGAEGETKERVWNLTPTCYVCKQCFNDAAECDEHIDTHYVVTDHQCKCCKYYFSSEDNLDSHMEIGNKQSEVNCRECKESFTLVCHYNYHIVKTKNKKPFQCIICKLFFQYHRSVMSHMIHHMSHLFCSLCTKGFRRKQMYKNHMRTHVGKVPFLCRYCYALLTNETEFLEHIDKHDASKHCCTICNKYYRSLATLKHHMKIHVERALWCEICKRGFNNEKKYERHVREHFTPVSTYDCTVCGKKFFRELYLKEHYELYHQDEQTPKQPDEQFKEYQEYMYGCGKCSTRFRTENDLKEHIRNHNDSQAEADFQPKTFKCHPCDVIFESRLVLRLHLRDVHKHVHCRHHHLHNHEGKLAQH